MWNISCLNRENKAYDKLLSPKSSIVLRHNITNNFKSFLPGCHWPCARFYHAPVGRAFTHQKLALTCSEPTTRTLCLHCSHRCPIPNGYLPVCVCVFHSTQEASDEINEWKFRNTAKIRARVLLHRPREGKLPNALQWRFVSQENLRLVSHELSFGVVIIGLSQES